MEQDLHEQSEHHPEPKHQIPSKSEEKFSNSKSQPQIKRQKDRLFERYWYIIEQKLLNNKQISLEKRQSYKNLLLRSKEDKKIDRALGAIYGAMIGDALGAYCQFQSKLSEKTVNEAMLMKGGGTFGLFAGQFTDDSELATHLLRGLNKFNPIKNLNQSQNTLICQLGLQYVQWVSSGPFDIGNTCRSGISSVYKHVNHIKQYISDSETQQPLFFKQMFETVYSRNHNNQSQSNGSLMRISPFAAFFSTIGEDPFEYEAFIKNEIRLTHSNPRLGVAGFCWVTLLTSLINRQGDAIGEFQKILNNLTKNERFNEIRSWIEQASKPKQKARPANPQMGYAKIAFSYGLRVLFYLANGKQLPNRENLYQDWMRWIIQRAGDTDTNAAIAGGLIGSVIGFWNLPEKYILKTLVLILDGRDFKFTGNIDEEINLMFENYQSKGGKKRSQIYEPCNVLLQALDMISKGQQYRKHHNKQK